MSSLKDKSDINIDAAEILFNKSLFAPSVHCSYYSCFQLLVYTYIRKLKIDCKTFSQNVAVSKQNTHSYVTFFMEQELNKLPDRKESRSIIRKFKDLKQFRVESDYYEINVDVDKGDSALRIAKEIRYFINTKF